METQLPGGNPDAELVLFDRQRTGRELGERARRVVGAVEIQIDDTVFGERCVKKAPRLVSLGLARQVLEDEKQILVARRLVHRLETIRAASHRELDVAGTFHL